MWAPDQWKVNKGKIVIRRSQSSTIALNAGNGSKTNNFLIPTAISLLGWIVVLMVKL